MVQRIIRPHRVDYFALFNGDHLMVNGLVNFPSIVTGGRISIPFNQMNLVDGIKLVQLLLATTINMQNYVGRYQQHGRIVGNGIDIFTINSKRKCISSLKSS